VMTLDPGLEQLLHNVLQQQGSGHNMVLEPGLAERLFAALREGSKSVEELGHNAVLVVSPAIRPWLSKAVRHRVNELIILSTAKSPMTKPSKSFTPFTLRPRRPTQCPEFSFIPLF